MPKFASGSGSMTEWITCCRCDIVSTPDPEAQKLSVDLCSTCGKRINKGRSGSFTQFIFRYDLCSCGTPAGGKSGAASFHDANETLTAPPVPLDDDEDEFEVDQSLSIGSETFPVDRYQPIKRIGMGAIGNVYLCHDVNLNKRVAVKTLHSSLMGQQLVAFQNEARVLSKLEHANIVRILDFGVTAQGSPYMVLEYGKGTPLSVEIAERGALDIELTNKVFAQLINALTYCHDHSVMHRDLKPENILLYTGKDGSIIVKLIDFGIAMIADQDQEKTAMDGKTITGTPAYMPPDQVRGYKYDARSEIYSLGCVLYEALAGRPPFSGETALDVLNKHANEQPLAVAAIAEQAIPQNVQDAIEKCLRKRPADRFQSMKELGKALGYEHEEESINELTEPPDQSRKQTRLLAGAIACSIVMTAAGIGFFVQQENAKQEKDRIAKAKRRLKKERSQTVTGFPRYERPMVGGKKLDYRVEIRTGPKDILVSGVLNREALEDIAMKYRPTTLAIGGIDMSAIDWSALSALKNMSSLFELDLMDTQFSDADIESLKGVQQIRKLNLRGTKITNAGLKKLQESNALPKLEVLLIGHTRTTGDIFPTLYKIPNLRNLDLEALDMITPAHLRMLVKMPRINGLDFGSNPIGDEGLRIISEKNLDTLSLEDCNVSDKGVAYLSHQTTLRKLNLAHNPNVTDKSLPILAKLPNLIVLRTGMRTAISERGRAWLEKQKPDLVIKIVKGWNERPAHTEVINEAATSLGDLEELDASGR
jgi:serine/threonine protein kinase